MCMQIPNKGKAPSCHPRKCLEEVTGEMTGTAKALKHERRSEEGDF